MKRYNRRRQAQEEAALDLTPMMDIVFIMLIFFIVTTSFVKETGVEVNRPNAETAERDEKGNILVAITENDEIYIDKRRIDLIRMDIEGHEIEVFESLINFSYKYKYHLPKKIIFEAHFPIYTSKKEYVKDIFKKLLDIGYFIKYFSWLKSVWNY